MSREARTTTLRDSPARTPTASLSIHAYMVNGLHVSMSTRPSLSPVLYLSPLSRAYVVRNVGEKKGKTYKIFAILYCGSYCGVFCSLILIAIEMRVGTHGALCNPL